MYLQRPTHQPSLSYMVHLLFRHAAIGRFGHLFGYSSLLFSHVIHKRFAITPFPILPSWSLAIQIYLEQNQIRNNLAKF